MIEGFCYINTLMLFWPILSQRKTSLVVFLVTILFLMALYQAIRNNIVAKKTTELVLLFHKNITKLVFL